MGLAAAPLFLPVALPHQAQQGCGDDEPGDREIGQGQGGGPGLGVLEAVEAVHGNLPWRYISSSSTLPGAGPALRRSLHSGPMPARRCPTLLGLARLR